MSDGLSAPAGGIGRALALEESKRLLIGKVEELIDQKAGKCPFPKCLRAFAVDHKVPLSLFFDCCVVKKRSLWAPPDSRLEHMLTLLVNVCSGHMLRKPT